MDTPSTALPIRFSEQWDLRPKKLTHWFG